MSLWGNKDTAAIAGQIGIPNGSPTVTGTGTAFANASTGLKPGSFIVIVGVKYKIKTITSDTVLTLTSNYEGTTLAANSTVITRHLAPTHLSLAEGRKAVFVSREEAALTTNKAKGVTGAGWWLFNEQTDSSGKPRYKAECLVAMTVLNAVSSDSAATGEDLIASDDESIITISGQPTNQSTTVASGAATFSVTASRGATTGTLTYQWQRALVATPTRFANVAAATSASLILAGRAIINSGDLYRVVIGTDAGAAKVTSNAATLTVTAT